MNTNACREIPLVDALRDGRLGPQDRASTERHIASCADCRAYANELELIGAVMRAPRPEASELQHQRARRALLTRATATPRSNAFGGYRALALVAAMMLVAVGSGFGFSRLQSPTGRALAALRLHIPTRAPIPRETTIHASRGASFEHKTDAGLETVALTSGELDVRVRSLASGERFVVKTGDAEIDVKGTSFHVAAEDGKIRSVTVDEGSVEVRYAGFTAIIPSGGSWRANGDAPTGALPAASAPAASASGAAPVAALPTPVAAVEPRAPRAPSQVALVVPPKPAPEPEPTNVTPPKRELSAASRAFADAMDALARGDNELAADRFQGFAKTYASDPRSDEAEYLRAIALQRAGHDGDARAQSKRYLEARPQGAHRADAKVLSGN